MIDARQGPAPFPLFIHHLTICVSIMLFACPVFGGDLTDAGDCAFAPRNGEFSSFSKCLEQDKDRRLSISSKYVNKLQFRQQGLAEVYSPEHGWMYVNRTGRVVIEGVAAMDNGADQFHDGLVRFSMQGKWGFADASGNVVIRPRYDGALNFEKRIARVCIGCKDACVDKDCEYHRFEGGTWLCLDTAGKEVPCAP